MKQYKLFFSYQSDTKHEFKFIKSILDNEIKTALSAIEIDLIVDIGMRDVAGNPELLNTMLTKGKKCDIFLADLTYVTDFINSDGNPKYVPNPNVMLELGHAWNHHKNNHTIFIQNKANGKAEDLPVDLKGFRFPISYELNDKANPSEKSTVKKELAKDLIKAIQTAVASIEEDDKTIFLPFEKFAYCSLQKTHNKYAFIKTDYSDGVINELNNKLSIDNAAILSGKIGCGKSRIVKEFVCQNFSQQQQNDIFYCKLSQTSKNELFNKVKRLKNELTRDSYFIIDKCDDATLTELIEILCTTKHKVIAISEKSDKNEQIKIDAKAYISKIIEIKAPDKCSKLSDSYITDIHHILALLNNETYQPNTYNVDKDSETLLSYISLFSKIGFIGQFEDEFSHLCLLFKQDLYNSRNIVKRLIKEGYIVSLGGFIFIESDAVAKEYAKRMWGQDLTAEITFEALLEKGNLAEWFINRQIQVESQSSECSLFLKSIIKTKLRNITFVDSNHGKLIIHQLAKRFSKDTLNSLEILCNENKEYKFNEIYGIFWGIEQIIKEKGLFSRAI